MKWLLAFADFCTFPFFFGKRYFPSSHAPAGCAPADLFFLRAFAKEEDAHVHTQVRGVIRSADGGARWRRGGGVGGVGAQV